MIQRNDIEENLKRGILEMLILKMLSQEDMYGYQMINEMNIRGEGLIDIKEGLCSDLCIDSSAKTIFPKIKSL